MWLRDCALYHPRRDRRLCVDSRRAAIDLYHAALAGEVAGVLMGVMRRDGCVDLVLAGDCYTYQVGASGLAMRLVSVTTHLFNHPLDGDDVF